MAAERVHGLEFPGIDGEALDLDRFEGQPLLLANTASRCGFTQQYAALQDLWQRYRDQGLVVIGMPSGDFNQELADAEAIRSFCEVNFGIDFPMTDKLATRGPDRHPFFAAVEAQLGAAALPRWNFHKYLVDRDGNLVAAWPSQVRPDSAEIRRAIQSVL
ncbi:MAG: glutathione peroxidase [Geminicoccaceae bacterium]|nr:MAG: glutathione peroxidase [Geminicoccaceae bacterium]